MSKVHCNRVECQMGFEVEEERTNKFFGSAAVRTQNFHTCPHCGMTDSHWFYASDEMPTFEGSDGRVRELQRKWRNAN